MNEHTICRNFLNNTKVYPDNPNKILKWKYGPFNNYVQKCRDLGYNKEVDELLNKRKNKFPKPLDNKMCNNTKEQLTENLLNIENLKFTSDEMDMLQLIYQKIVSINEMMESHHKNIKLQYDKTYFIFRLLEYEPIALNIFSKINNLDYLYKLYIINKESCLKLLNNPYVLNLIAPNFYIKGEFSNFRNFYIVYVNNGGGFNPNFNLGLNPYNYEGHVNYKLNN